MLAGPRATPAKSGSDDRAAETYAIERAGIDERNVAERNQTDPAERCTSAVEFRTGEPVFLVGSGGCALVYARLGYPASPIANP